MVATLRSKVLILIVTFICINVVATSDFIIKTDSHLKIISSSKGKQKLDAYHELLSLNHPIEEADNALKFANEYTGEKESNRLRWLGTVGVCVFLLIIILIYFIYSRKLKRKNASIYQKILELTVVEKKAEQCLLSTPKAKLSKEMQLYQQISECMQREKLFTNPILNRKKLSDYLDTSEAYLAESIHEGSGETFSSYISNLRLQFSLELLKDHSEMTLNAIAIDSGHGSYSPFYKAFTKKYSITPSEYRKLSATTSIKNILSNRY